MTDRPSGITSFACRYDGAPCEIVAHFDHALATESRPRLHELVSWHLPCTSCGRALDAGVAGLRGVRLGRTERRVLLQAAANGDDEATVIAPPEHSRAVREATLRAARKLRVRGLLRIAYESAQAARMRSSGPHPLRAAMRSPLGEEIVKRFRKELESGQRIRWDERLIAAGRAARRDLPLLLQRLVGALEATRERRAFLAGLFAAAYLPATRSAALDMEDAQILLTAARAALATLGGLAELATHPSAE
jgi:hypothetical protein